MSWGSRNVLPLGLSKPASRDVIARLSVFSHLLFSRSRGSLCPIVGCVTVVATLACQLRREVIAVPLEEGRQLMLRKGDFLH